MMEEKVIKRLKEEALRLKDRIDTLNDFLIHVYHDKPSHISDKQRDLMVEQQIYMTKYLDVLNTRLLDLQGLDNG